LKRACKHANLCVVRNSEAYLLRENTGTSGLEQTARTAVAVLADHEIPHLIVGGVAVQEHGYPRVTIGVDIVVPVVLEAVDWLTADLSGPFVQVSGCHDRVIDSRTGVRVDFLPAGRMLRHGCQVPFPGPPAVSEQPQIVGLAELIALKLDSWAGSPVNRHKDKTDVIELIKRRNLARDLAIASSVRALYIETWDALKAES
jgi:hypothetical protein